MINMDKIKKPLDLKACINCIYCRELNLFRREIVSIGPNKNIIISPVSLYLSLALTVNGANGQTQTEIFKILRI